MYSSNTRRALPPSSITATRKVTPSPSASHDFGSVAMLKVMVGFEAGTTIDVSTVEVGCMKRTGFSSPSMIHACLPTITSGGSLAATIASVSGDGADDARVMFDGTMRYRTLSASKNGLPAKAVGPSLEL